MSSFVPPQMPDLPTRVELRRAALTASIIAVILAGVAVLPAEYGFDPTGIGARIGLTQMGKAKVALATNAVPAGPVTGDAVTDLPDGGKRVQIVLAPYAGREVKAVMQGGAQMRYEWFTSGEAVEFEFHGEPDNPKIPGEYSSYKKGRKSGETGKFKAEFPGHHGWFWKNSGPRPVTVTAVVRGNVQSFAPIYAQGEHTQAMPAAASAVSSDAAPYDTSEPLKEFMNHVMDYLANEVWKRQGYITDEKGTRSLFPGSDEEWKTAENNAVTLAEVTNILLVPGRRVPDPVWDKAVAEVRSRSLEVAATARRKDKDAFMEAGVRLNDACNACHVKYASGAS